VRLLKTAMREGRTAWLQAFAARPAASRLTTPVISISFDDVPRSAFEFARPMLNDAGLKATFYACLGMSPQEQALHLGPDELLTLVREGHEVGCHTFSHYRLYGGSAAELAADAQRNRLALQALDLGVSSLHFSYPFGHVSFTAKRVLAPHYASMRSSRPGVNSGRVDLNCLKAVPLYEERKPLVLLEASIQRTGRCNGWLILYTHGVCESPGPHDLSIGSFTRVLERCAATGWPILPVGAASRTLSGAPAT